VFYIKIFQEGVNYLCFLFLKSLSVGFVVVSKETKKNQVMAWPTRKICRIGECGDFVMFRMFHVSCNAQFSASISLF